MAVRCAGRSHARTSHGLPIPITSELAIEGFIVPPEIDSRAEGPFGEWTGYYASGTRNEPVVKVKTVMYRNDPIILGMPPGISGKSVPPSAANIWLALEKAGVTDVKGVWEYTTRYITAISIQQKYGGHVKRVAMAMLGSTYGYHRRFIILVDEDVDPSTSMTFCGRWQRAAIRPRQSISSMRPGAPHWTRGLRRKRARRAISRIPLRSSTPASRIIGEISMPRPVIFRRRCKKTYDKWKATLQLD